MLLNGSYNWACLHLNILLARYIFSLGSNYSTHQFDTYFSSPSLNAPKRMNKKSISDQTNSPPSVQSIKKPEKYLPV